MISLGVNQYASSRGVHNRNLCSSLSLAHIPVSGLCHLPLEGGGRWESGMLMTLRTTAAGSRPRKATSVGQALVNSLQLRPWGRTRIRVGREEGLLTEQLGNRQIRSFHGLKQWFLMGWYISGGILVIWRRAFGQHDDYRNTVHMWWINWGY